MRTYTELLILGAIYGSSFIFIRIAAPAVGALVLVESRALFALMVLVPALLIRGRAPDTAAISLKAYVVPALLAMCLPAVLVAYSGKYLSAAVMAILHATAPLFTLLYSMLFLNEAYTSRIAIGLLCGVAGVALVVGHGIGVTGSSAESLGAFAACLAACAMYGLGNVLAAKNLKGASPLQISVGQCIFTACFLVPLIAFFPHPLAVTVPVALSACLLGVLSTGIALLLFYRLLKTVGPTRTMTVTFVVPFFGCIWGFLLLDETVSALQLTGMVVILAGTALVWLKGSEQQARPWVQPPASREKTV